MGHAAPQLRPMDNLGLSFAAVEPPDTQNIGAL